MIEILNEIIKHIIEKLNYGYKENIYQLALCYELENNGYKIQREVVKDIIYHYYVLGNVRADIVVDDKYIIEMKAISKVTEKEINQVKRYLELFNLMKGYIVNVNYKNYEIIEVHGKERFDPVSY